MNKYLPLLGIFGFTLLLFFPIFSVYFSQDDFFHFKASLTNGSVESFIKQFGFPSFEDRGYAFYRPLTREALYNIYYALFSLEHLPFRILSILIHGVNIFLIFLLARRLFSQKIAYISSLIFALSAINIGVLYYGAGGIETSAVTSFILLSVIFFDKYLNTDKIHFLNFSIYSFVFALMSHEVGAVIPALLFGILYIRAKSTKVLVSESLKSLWIFGLLLLVYLYLDLVKIGLKQSQVQYQPVFSVSSFINTFMWYTGWALGLPEMLIDFVYPGFKLNPNLTKYWGDYFKIIFPTFFLLLGGLIFQSIVLGKLILNKRTLYLALWFIVALLPVALLPQHKFVHYLAPSMVAGSILIAFVIANSKKFVAIFLLTLFLALNLTSIKLAEKTYWAINRGRVTEKLINDFKSQYKVLPQGAIVYIKNDPNYPFISEDWGGTAKQARLALNDQDAFQLLYKDTTIKIYYEDIGIPEDLLKSEVFELTAKIN